WVVNDRRTAGRALLTTRVIDFAGNQVSAFSVERPLDANTSWNFLTFPDKEFLKGADPAKVVLVAELEVKGEPVQRNLLFFKKTKDLDLPKPELKLAVAPGANGALAVSVSAKKLARNVFLASNAIDGFFDDNYFDVLPGETVTVAFRPHAPTTAAALQAA